jgi:hypothetical protein
MYRAQEKHHVSRQDNFDARKGTDVFDRGSIQKRAAVIATTHLFGVGTSVERATAAATEVQRAAMALTSAYSTKQLEHIPHNPKQTRITNSSRLESQQ